MAVTQQTTVFRYVAAVGATVFAYGCRILAAADLVVQVNGVTRTFGVDYTLSGVSSPSGGNVTFGTAMLGGEFVKLYRATALTRASDYQIAGDFLAPTVNRDFDRPLAALVDLAGGTFRIPNTLQGPAGEILDPLPEAALRSNKQVVFGPTGQLFLQVPASGSAADVLFSLGSSNGAGLVSFMQAAADAVLRSVQSKLREISISVTDFGSVGTPSLNLETFSKAITWANTQSIPVRIDIPTGFFAFNAPLPPITTSTTLHGKSPRSTILFPSGNFDFIKFGGTVSRAPNVGITDLQIAAAGMTGGFAVVFDWLQHPRLTNVTLSNVWNGLSIRQCGETQLDIRIDGGRGQYGVRAYGTGAIRNGQSDQTDVIAFARDVTITGSYVPGGPIPTFECIVLDGWVHTVTFGSLRLLLALRGLRTMNTPALAQKFAPSFIIGTNLETESTYAEGCLFEWVNVVETTVFAATSVSESGWKLGANANRIKLNALDISGCWKHGLDISGAVDVEIKGASISRTGYAGLNVYSGIHIASGDSISVSGGRLGQLPYDTGYTEQQWYGLRNVGGTNVRMTSVDVRGNSAGGISGDVYYTQCPGAPTIPGDTLTVTTPTWSYTSGNIPETLYFNGGTVSLITVDGLPVGTSTERTVMVPPRGVVQVTSTVAPTCRRFKSVG